VAKNTQTENEILQRLDEININIKKLLSVVGMQGKEEEKQIVALSAAGFTSVEIEQIIGVPAGSVRRRLHEKRHKNR
jgi:hypothetical protein